MKNRNSDEILQYLASNGMLDIGNVERAIEMQKRKEYLSKHTQKNLAGERCLLAYLSSLWQKRSNLNQTEK